MVREPKTQALTVRFSEKDAEMLRKLSEQQDVSAAQIVRKALREYAKKHLK